MTRDLTCDVTISVVSHGHGSLVLRALESLSASLQSSGQVLRVCLTLNLPEPELVKALDQRSWPFDLRLIHNPVPLGFGSNHNQAFAYAQLLGETQWFIIMNPDIFWPEQAHDFWTSLIQNQWPPAIGLLCPQQIDTCGNQQDFSRQIMTPWSLLIRTIRKAINLQPSGIAPSISMADWVNGACMVWRSKAFSNLGGFDERYFMYCEDTDICLRMHLAGWRMQEANLSVIHDARRSTGRSWKHLRWHLHSLWRMWASAIFWRYQNFRRQKPFLKNGSNLFS